jgi:hypothetical protein
MTMKIKTTYEKPKSQVWIDDICVGFGIGKKGLEECRALADELKEDSTKAVLVKNMFREYVQRRR